MEPINGSEHNRGENRAIRPDWASRTYIYRVPVSSFMDLIQLYYLCSLTHHGSEGTILGLYRLVSWWCNAGLGGSKGH